MEELHKQITQHLNAGWTIERLTLVERNLLRLKVFQITSFDTPQLVAVNEAIKLIKDFSDQISCPFYQWTAQPGCNRRTIKEIVFDIYQTLFLCLHYLKK